MNMSSIISVYCSVIKHLLITYSKITRLETMEHRNVIKIFFGHEELLIDLGEKEKILA